MIEGEVLAPEFIEKILSTLPRTENDRERLEAEIETRSAEVVNLTKAIAAGGDIPELVAALKVASRRLADSKRLLDVSTQETPREELRAALEQRVEDWREKLRAHPAQARQIVSKIHRADSPVELCRLCRLYRGFRPTRSREGEYRTD